MKSIIATIILTASFTAHAENDMHSMTERSVKAYNINTGYTVVSGCEVIKEDTYTYRGQDAQGNRSKFVKGNSSPSDLRIGQSDMFIPASFQPRLTTTYYVVARPFNVRILQNSQTINIKQNKGKVVVGRYENMADAESLVSDLAELGICDGRNTTTYIADLRTEDALLSIPQGDELNSIDQ